MGRRGGWSCNSAAERAHQDYLRREQRYAGLVTSLRGFYAEGTHDEKAQFLAELDLCWLYCSDVVIRDAYRFLDTVKTGAKSSKAEKERALGQLVLSIRQDLLRRAPVAETQLASDEFRVLKPN